MNGRGWLSVRVSRETVARLARTGAFLWLAAVGAGLTIGASGAVFGDRVDDVSEFSGAAGGSPAPTAWPLEMTPGASRPFGSKGAASPPIARYDRRGELYLDFGEAPVAIGARPSVLKLSNRIATALSARIEIDVGPNGRRSRPLPAAEIGLRPGEQVELGVFLCLPAGTPPRLHTGSLLIRIEGYGEKTIPLRVRVTGAPRVRPERPRAPGPAEADDQSVESL